MRLFTSNQVNNVYVVNGTVASKALVTAGKMFIGTTPDNNGLYFITGNADGNPVRSDIISIDNIHYGTIKKGESTILKTYTLQVADAAKSSGKPIEGEEYILRIVANNYIGISKEDSQYWKYGVVKVTKNMSLSDFYKKMALSVAGNMAREAVQFLKVELMVSTTPTEVTPYTKESDLSGSYTAIRISEVNPDWLLGTKQQKIIGIELVPSTVNDGVSDVIWGNVTTGTAIGECGNAKLAADYEYFHMGERGDQYRMVGWPNYVPTKYLVNGAVAGTYDFVSIHYSYVGPNEGSQKSEKDITLLVNTGAGLFTGTAVATEITTAINKAIFNGISLPGTAAASSSNTSTP